MDIMCSMVAAWSKVNCLGCAGVQKTYSLLSEFVVGSGFSCRNGQVVRRQPCL